MNLTAHPMAGWVQLGPDPAYGRLIVRRLAQQVIEHHLLSRWEELGEHALGAEYGRHEELRHIHAALAEDAEDVLMARLELPDLHLRAQVAAGLGAAIQGAALEADRTERYQAALARRQRLGAAP